MSGQQFDSTTRDTPGLTSTPEKRWPSIKPVEADIPPIDRLMPNSELHNRVRNYLNDRVRMSERGMQRFYDRWRYAERRYQAYIDLKNYEQIMQEENDAGKPSKVVSIHIPYIYATIQTIVTYLFHTFAGRKPIFQVSTYSDAMDAAQKMEILLDYNSTHTKLQKHLFQFFQDGEIYGVQILRTAWKKKERVTTVWKRPDAAQQQQQTFLGLAGQQTDQPKRVREKRTVYEGNDVTTIDPYMFFPDTRVAMTEVNRKGEFVVWRTFEGKHLLKRLEGEGLMKWVDYAGDMPKPQSDTEDAPSNRAIRSKGVSHPGQSYDHPDDLPKNYVQVDQGTYWIVPSELGLGPEKVPQLWIFTMLNRNQIVQAEPFDADHDMHPVAVGEPYSLGYGLGNLGQSDYLGPSQDTISWFITSHIHNVRTALNNMWVVDPSRIEMQDLKKPGAGKIIRVKSSAYGQDVQTFLNQLPVQDVTRSHISDLETFVRFADGVSAVTDNVRGLQDSGGRKTATEVRTGAEAAASRLAAHARLISAQSITDLTEQMCLNIQQYLSMEFYYQVLGRDGRRESHRIAPEHVTGDFYFPVHDGTLPLDKVAMVDVWKEILVAVMSSEQLSATYDIGKIFEHTAELGGARNIESFRLQTSPENVLTNQVQAGNMVPLPGAGPITNERASQRAAGGIEGIGG